MNNSKCLVLPSYEDHWGVVVHEGICSGCLLILSNNVGSKMNFLKKMDTFLIPINMMNCQKNGKNFEYAKKRYVR